MAGPYTGSWRASVVSQAEYTGASKWGTGINPVHSNATMGPYLGGPAKLVIDPISTPGGDNTYGYIAEDQAWEFTSDNPDPNLPQYDQVNIPDLWGSNEQTGTTDRPRWGNEQGDSLSSEMGWGLPNPDPGPPPPISQRAKTQNSTRDDYPPWGGSRKTAPLGTRIRALMRGDALQTKMRVLPNEDVAQGWVNKGGANFDLGTPADSRPSDDSQIFIQTSDVQRYKTREGSQNIGSQSTFNSPVQSRVRGQKVKVYAAEDSARHWDMLPYEQNDYPRPFLSRQAGTGYPYWQLTNEMYVSPAIQREPPADPSLGTVAGISGTGGNTGGTITDYGYSYEDGQYY